MHCLKVGHTILICRKGYNHWIMKSLLLALSAASTEMYSKHLFKYTQEKNICYPQEKTCLQCISLHILWCISLPLTLLYKSWQFSSPEEITNLPFNRKSVSQCTGKRKNHPWPVCQITGQDARGLSPQIKRWPKALCNEKNDFQNPWGSRQLQSFQERENVGCQVHLELWG